MCVPGAECPGTNSGLQRGATGRRDPRDSFTVHNPVLVHSMSDRYNPEPIGPARWWGIILDNLIKERLRLPAKRPIAQFVAIMRRWISLNLRNMPWLLPGCALVLMLAGITGIARGDELSHAGKFFDKQVVWILVALPAMLLATVIPYRLFRHHSYAWLALSVVLLAIAFLFP